MLFKIFQWIWLALIVIGVPLLALRPLSMRFAKTPLTDRRKGWLWFWQSLGFWAVLICTWMRLEGVIGAFFDNEDDAPPRVEAADANEPGDDADGESDTPKGE